MKQRFFTTVVVAALLMLSVADARAQAPGYLVMKDAVGTQVRGQISWMGGSRIYEIRDPQNPSIARSVPFDQVRDVNVKKPDQLDAAIAAMEEGRYTGAHITALQQICQKYEMLQHDLTAGSALARAYVETGKAAETEELYRKLKASRRAADLPGTLVSAYWDALLKLNKSSILTREIDTMLRDGSRGAVAAAYIIKGDIQQKEGKFEDALIDGYLRTVVLYRDIKEVQPEALYKAYLCFKELNQVTRAENMQKKLVDGFPKSAYTRKLQSEN
ncbi:MAG: hypothetical protein O3C57_00180 [Verrucomicrobia bacterium]|nr:hypothetical protein [Verrucomicrobiota bacterium]